MAGRSKQDKERRYALLVEGNVTAAIHRGVRSRYLTLLSILRQQITIDLIEVSYHPISRQAELTQVILSSDYIANNGFVASSHIQGNARDLVKLYPSLKQQQTGDCFEGRLALGNKLTKDDYDVVIIAAPWLWQDNLALAKDIQKIGIVHDITPMQAVINSYTGQPEMLDFAHYHHYGFRKYNQCCTKILANSAAVKADYVSYYQADFPDLAERCQLLPACAAAPFYQPLQQQTISSKQTVILATPLENRKGMAIIPAILNRAKQQLQRLIIYGDASKTTPRQMKQFFRELPANLVIDWYPQATSQQLSLLFEQANVLLFASQQEGLGIPLIEAQLRGCRLVCFDIAPMNQLNIDDNPCLFNGDNTEAIIVNAGKKLQQALQESSNLLREKIYTKAQQYFATEKIGKLITSEI